MYGNAGSSGAGGGGWRNPWVDPKVNAATTSPAVRPATPLLQNLVALSQQSSIGLGKQLRNPFGGQSSSMFNTAAPAHSHPPQSQNPFAQNASGRNSFNPFTSARKDQEPAAFDSMSMKRSMKQNQNRQQSQTQQSYSQYTQGHGTVSRNNNNDSTQSSGIDWQLRSNAGHYFNTTAPPPPPPPPPEEPSPPAPAPNQLNSSYYQKPGLLPLMSVSFQQPPPPTHGVAPPSLLSAAAFSSSQTQQQNAAVSVSSSDIFGYNQSQQNSPFVPSIMKAPVPSLAQTQRQIPLLGTHSFASFGQSSIFGNHPSAEAPSASASAVNTVFGAPVQQLPNPTQTWFEPKPTFQPPLPEESAGVPAPNPNPPVSESSGFWKKETEEIKANANTPAFMQPLSQLLPPLPDMQQNRNGSRQGESDSLNNSTDSSCPPPESGGIITTNLTALMDIIVPKIKDPTSIPGLGDLPPPSEENKSEQGGPNSNTNSAHQQSNGSKPTLSESEIANNTKNKTSSAPKSVISDLSDSSLIETGGTETSNALAYEKKELKAFENKFREWEKEFEDWKAANANHPDRRAYDKYVGQWESSRQKLIGQKRAMVDRLNKIRLSMSALAEAPSVPQANKPPEIAPRHTDEVVVLLEPIVQSSKDDNIRERAQSPHIQSEKLPNPSFVKAEEQVKKVEEKPLNPEEQKMKSFLKSGAVGVVKTDKIEQARNLIANPVALLGKGGQGGDINVELDDSSSHLAPVNPTMGRQPVNILLNQNQMNKFGNASNQPWVAGPTGSTRYPGTQFGPGMQLSHAPRMQRGPSDQNSYNQAQKSHSGLPKLPTINAKALKFAGSSKYDDEWEPNFREIDFQRRKDAEKEQQREGSRPEHGADFGRPFDPSYLRQQEFHPPQSHQQQQNYFKDDDTRARNYGFSSGSTGQDGHAFSSSSSLSENMYKRRNRNSALEAAKTDESAPVVIDYGHGSTAPKIENMYTRARRPAPVHNDSRETSAQELPDDEIASEAAVIDYGHGSQPVAIIPPKATENDEKDDAERFHARFEDDYYDEPEAEPEPEPIEFEYANPNAPRMPRMGFPPMPPHMRMRGPMMRPGFGPSFRPRFFHPMAPRWMGPRFGLPPPFYGPHPYDYAYPQPYPYPYEEQEGYEEEQEPEPSASEETVVESSYVKGMRVAPPLEPSDIHGSKSPRPMSPPTSSAAATIRSAPPLSPTSKTHVRTAPPLSPSPTTKHFRSAPPLSPRASKRVGLSDDLDWVSPERSPTRGQNNEKMGGRRGRDHSRDRDDRDRRPRERTRSREKDGRQRDRSRERREARDNSRERDERLHDRRREDRTRDSDRHEKVERDSTRRRSRSNDRVFRGGSPRKREASPRSRDRERDSHRDRRSRSPVSRSHTSGRRGSSPSASASVSPQVSRVHNPHSSDSPRYQTVMIEDILNLPGRKKRPHSIFIILRGLPGSGKTHVAKLIKDREVENGGSAPRILSLDDYFLTGESEKIVKDKNGKESKEKVMVYEYEAELEDKYRRDLLKTFKKTVDNGLFRFVILDCINDKVKHFDEFANHAKMRKFQVYIAELEGRVTECFLRNIHQRTKEEIQKIADKWEKHSYSLVKLDIRPLLQDEAVQDVEMEDVSDSENFPDDTSTNPPKPVPQEVVFVDLEEEDEPEPSWVKSKWDTSEERMNKLDGLNKKKKSDTDPGTDKAPQSVESWLQAHLPDDVGHATTHGKKRVRWADIEERREQERAREVGFVVGHTNWNRFTDPTFGDSALTKTKFI